MSYVLADYQQDVKRRVYEAYTSGARNVIGVLPTGAGKTVLMSDMAREYDGYGCSIAHRSELVLQISCALARMDVRHDIIAPKAVIRNIVKQHIDDTGRNYYDARAGWKVASVDTILRRDLPARWSNMVGFVHQDESHHVLAENKWGRAMQMFPNARAFLPTATPLRADGKGLGRHADGVADALVLGPDMRWMIRNGHLTGYKLMAPTARDLDMAGVQITDSGEYNQEQTRKRVKASTTIIGDVVGCYLEHCRGKLGITFAVDVEHATQIAEAFNRNGVPAAVVHAGTPEAERVECMRRFKRRELLQLVNVDLFGEGVDVPAVEVVSMARPTASYTLYVQQFGRALRLLVPSVLRAAWHTYTSAQRLKFIAESDKPFAHIFDHVGNVVSHGGPPDWNTPDWTLDGRDKRRRAVDGIPLRACANPMCLQPFERIYPACPYCGWEPPPPADRTDVRTLDGDLVLYDEAMLKALFDKKAKMDSAFVPVPQGAGPIVAAACRNRHRANQEAQAELRGAMALVLPPTVDERVNNRRFFHTYGVDTLTAQGLPSSEARELCQRIIGDMTK